MRKGIIKISKETYDLHWDLIWIVFEVFKPTHIEFRHWENDVWYFYGRSEKFDIVEEGELIPFYDIEFNVVEGTFEFKKL